MSNHEMPVIVRLSKEELAHAMGRPVDDADVERLGGLNVVLHPIRSDQPINVALKTQMTLKAEHVDALQNLAATLKPLEEQLFQRLRSDPHAGKRFLTDPMAALEEFGLMDAGLKAKVEPHRTKLAPLMVVK